MSIEHDRPTDEQNNKQNIYRCTYASLLKTNNKYLKLEEKTHKTLQIFQIGSVNIKLI